MAVAAGVQASAAPPPPLIPVAVAATDLPAGARIVPTDLVWVDFSPDSVPAGVVPDPVGRILAAPVREGEPVTDVRLMGPALVDAYPGLVAMPVRLPDAAMVDLLRVGDVVDLVASDPQGEGAAVVAAAVPVLALPPASPGDQAAGLPGRLIVIGCPPELVPEVADAATQDYLSWSMGG